LTACGETPAPNGSDSITDSSQAVSNQSQTGAKPNSNTSGGSANHSQTNNTSNTGAKPNSNTNTSGGSANHGQTNNTSNTGEVITASTATVSKNYGSLGSFLIGEPRHGSMLQSTILNASWTDSRNAESYTLVLEEYKDGKFITSKTYKGITGLSYRVKSLKAGSTYRWNVYAVNSAGTRVAVGSNNEQGNVVMAAIDPKTHPANKGLNFKFDGKISQEVLENYLSRSMTIADGLNSSPFYTSNCTEGTPEFVMSNIRMIINTGVKYVGRSGCNWNVSKVVIDDLVNVKQNIDYAHGIDPDIIFEACIFEAVYKSVEDVAIPAWVFEAFGLPAENRNFSFDKMKQADGAYVNQWGEGSIVPDITQQETQMFFYFLACSYIDAGFEALHMGQVHLIGRRDSGWKCYTKLNDMIRAYAKKNARRHMVLMNSHTHGITDANGYLMFDFHAWPMRGRVPSGSVAHAPTEGNPQEVELAVGHADSIYQRSLGGKTYSGWSCGSLPYVVEIDNYGVTNSINDPSRDHWGFDEISWFFNQPDEYRRSWLISSYTWVEENDSVGHFMMPGVRVAYKLSGGNSAYATAYHNYNPIYHNKGTGDEDTIRNIFIYCR